MSVKICIGSVFICCAEVGRRHERAPHAVNSSGAVSPIAAGDRQQRPGDQSRQRRSAAPPASPPASAARRARARPRAGSIGTSSRTTSAERTTIGSISSDERDRPLPRREAAADVAEHQHDVDEQAEHDRRHAGHHVDEVADDVGEPSTACRTRSGTARRRSRSGPRSASPARRSRSCRGSRCGCRRDCRRSCRSGRS